MESWSCSVHVFRCIPLSTQIWFIVHGSFCLKVFILLRAFYFSLCWRVIPRFFALSSYLSCHDLFWLLSATYPVSPGDLTIRPQGDLHLQWNWPGFYFSNNFLFPLGKENGWCSHLSLIFLSEAFFPPFVSGIVFGFSCQRSFSISVSSSQTFLSALDLFLFSPR